MGLRATLFSILVFGFCVNSIERVSGIVCYQCSTTADNSDCNDYRTLLKSARTFGVLTRNCTDKYCMTEKYVRQGVVYSFIRDCTDNKNGSYSFPLRGRLTLVKPDNSTVCRFDLKSLAQECISLCDSDLCNGPSGGPAVWPSGKTVLYTSMLVFFTVFQFWR